MREAAGGVVKVAGGISDVSGLLGMSETVETETQGLGRGFDYPKVLELCHFVDVGGGGCEKGSRDLGCNDIIFILIHGDVVLRLLKWVL